MFKLSVFNCQPLGMKHSRNVGCWAPLLTESVRKNIIIVFVVHDNWRHCFGDHGRFGWRQHVCDTV